MIKLKELLFGKPKCDCGCNDCSDTKLNEGVKVSENLQYHLDNKIPLGESIFRISSNAHVKLFAETRKLWEAGKITLSEADEYFMHTDAGRQGMYEGQLVPLDLPYVMEAKKLTYNDFVRMVRDDMMAGASPDEKPSDKQVASRAKSFYNDYLQGASVDDLFEVKKPKKKNPPLNKPKRGGPKAYYVYVRDPKTKKVKKVTFGSGGLKAKIGNKEASQAFAKRHDCKNKKDRTKASYWSCNLPRYAKQLGLSEPASRYW